MVMRDELVFVKVLRISLADYLPAEKTARFSVEFEDLKGTSEISKRMHVEYEAYNILEEMLRMAAAKRHYSADSYGNVNVVVENGEDFIRGMRELISRALRMIQTMDRKDAKSYLNALANINMLSIVLDDKK
ncbi:MAG: hypothetical protein QXW00_03250 [Candidatus Woesearchaeota archaeon]